MLHIVGKLLASAAMGGLLLAATPVCAATDAAAVIHARILPFDPHLDINIDFDSAAIPATTDGPGQFDLPKAKRGGLKAAGLAVFAPQQAETAETQATALRIAYAKHAIISGLAARYPDQVGRALSPSDVRKIAASGRLAIVETIVNGGAFVETLDDLDAWAAKGVVIFGFVHAGHNRLADSSRPSLARGETAAGRNGGLSDLGKQAVGRLNRLGVLIDVSQLSDAAFDDVLKRTRAPVIASHSDLRALVDNSRNLSDAQLQQLKANKGVVAINAFPAYLRPHDAAFNAKLDALRQEFGLSGAGSAPLTGDKAKAYEARYHDLTTTEPKPTVTDLVNAVDDAVRKIGIDHVALSSDFNHGGGIVGWANEGETGNVTAELVKHGYKEADIAKLWSGNVLRVWQAAQDVGRQIRAERASASSKSTAS